MKPGSPSVSTGQPHSTPIHHHLISKCPEQWLHHHEHFEKFSDESSVLAEKHHHGIPHHTSSPVLHQTLVQEGALADDMHIAKHKSEVEEEDEQGDSQEVNFHNSGHISRVESDVHFEDDESVSLKLSKHRSVVKMDEDNLDEIASLFGRGELSLGATLLKRLRKYKLITSTVNYDGRILVGISPRVTGRITRLD